MKLERIVVGVDFCRPSIEAARWTALHFAPDAEIVLLHAVDAPQPPGFLRGVLPPTDPVVENARLGALARLESLGRWTADPRVVLDVRTGPAAGALVQTVDARAADLLVVGDHGGRPGLGDALGTTVERTIADVAVPVLVARGLPPAEPRRILVAIGAEDGAARELAWARFLGSRFDASVEVLHVVAPTRFAPLEVAAGAAMATDLEGSRESAREWIEGASAAAGFESGEAGIRIEVGDPAREILAAAAAGSADLVVIGSRAAGALASGLAGGVARAVLRHGEDSVLVIGPLGR